MSFLHYASNFHDMKVDSMKMSRHPEGHRQISIGISAKIDMQLEWDLWDFDMLAAAGV